MKFFPTASIHCPAAEGFMLPILSSFMSWATSSGTNKKDKRKTTSVLGGSSLISIALLLLYLSALFYELPFRKLVLIFRMDFNKIDQRNSI